MDANGYSFPNDKGIYEKHSVLPLHDYQRNRILSFVDPDKIDPMGIGWNQRQSLISVGSGGLYGKGWTEGTQAQLGYPLRGRAQRFYLLGNRRGKRISGKPHGSRSVWSDVVQWHTHRRSPQGTASARCSPSASPCQRMVHVFVNIAMTIGLVPITGYTASLYQLRWLLCAQLLHAARTGPERLSLPARISSHDHSSDPRYRPPKPEFPAP